MIVVPYTSAKLHPETVRALNDHSRGPVDWREINPNDHAAYYRILADAWQQPGDLIIIEHDVEIHSDVLPQFAECREPWCGFPYGIGYQQQLLVCLGCTRFTDEIKQAVPNLFGEVAQIADDNVPPMHWCRLDVRLSGRLEARGYEKHYHEPPVTHHHEYDY